MADAHSAAAPRELAGHVQQAAEIAGEQRVGAGGTTSAVLSLTILSEISGYLTLNVPPKPQQISARQLHERQPGDRASNRRGCALHAEFAQAGAGIVIGHDAGIAASTGSRPITSVRNDMSSYVFAASALARAGNGRIILEQVRVMPPEHAGARARGHDDVVEAGESRDDLARDRLASCDRPNYRRAGRSRSAPPAPRRRSRHARTASRQQTRRWDGTDRQGR